MRILILFLVLLSLCSCSKPEEPIVENPKSEVETVETREASAKPVFVYGNNELAGETVKLNFKSKPITFQGGCVRLAGIIFGDSPLACLEVSGKGQFYSAGDSFENYVVSKIKKEEVVLCLKK